MDRKLEARVARLERLVYNRSVTNEGFIDRIVKKIAASLGISNVEERSAKILKTFKNKDHLNKLNGYSVSDEHRKENGAKVTTWKFKVPDTSSESNNIKLLNALLNLVSLKAGLPRNQPDFSSVKHNGNIYLMLSEPDLEDLKKADHNLIVVAYYKDSSRLDSEPKIIYELKLRIKDLDEFKEYLNSKESSKES